MYEVRSDFGKNRLYLTVRGRMDLGEFKPFTISAIVEAKKLQPEFAIVLDISEFVPANEEVRQLMQDSMQKLREMGVGPVVRVVRPDAMVEASQCSTHHPAWWEMSPEWLNHMKRPIKTGCIPYPDA